MSLKYIKNTKYEIRVNAVAQSLTIKALSWANEILFLLNYIWHVFVLLIKPKFNAAEMSFAKSVCISFGSNNIRERYSLNQRLQAGIHCFATFNTVALSSLASNSRLAPTFNQAHLNAAELPAVTAVGGCLSSLILAGGVCES